MTKRLPDGTNQTREQHHVGDDDYWWDTGDCVGKCGLSTCQAVADWSVLMPKTLLARVSELPRILVSDHSGCIVIREEYVKLHDVLVELISVPATEYVKTAEVTKRIR